MIRTTADPSRYVARLQFSPLATLSHSRYLFGEELGSRRHAVDCMNDLDHDQISLLREHVYAAVLEIFQISIALPTGISGP